MTHPCMLPPDVTPERQAIWDEYINEYAVSCIQRWISQGADEDLALRCAAVVLDEFSLASRPVWMPLLTAQLHQVSVALDITQGVLEGADRLDFISAQRTLKTSTEIERVSAGAYHMGVSPEQFRKMAMAGQPVDKGHHPGRTALYRHYGEDGALLYVGIAKDPEARAEQHRASSEWHFLSARVVVEWFPTRIAARTAERESIAGERPLFNIANASEGTKQAAISYLLRMTKSARVSS